MKRPLLVGASRKSFIGRLTEAAVEDRLAGSLRAPVAPPKPEPPFSACMMSKKPSRHCKSGTPSANSWTETPQYSRRNSAFSDQHLGMAETGLAVDSPRAGGDLRAGRRYLLYFHLSTTLTWLARVLGFLILIGITTLIALWNCRCSGGCSSNCSCSPPWPSSSSSSPSCAGSWRN